MILKRRFALITLIVISPLLAVAQISEKQQIQDSSFGWMKLYHFKGAKAARALGNRSFSIAQLSVCDSFANWIQASYIPKGTIGDVRRVIMPEIGLYNKHQLFSPQGYGATSYTWTLQMKNGKPTPIQETEIPWGITANEVPGISMEKLCTNGDYYFFMEELDPFDPGLTKEVVNKYNIKTLPQFSTFYTQHSTASRYDRNAGIVDAVLLCKNNQLPFIKVTIGDLLDKAGKLITDEHEKKIKDIREKNKDNQKSIDYFTNYENTNYQKALLTYDKHKEKYKNRLNDWAAIPSNFDYIDFSNGYDIFTRMQMNESGSSVKTFPVYKFGPGIVEQSKQDKPLWIRVTWSWMLADERTRHMHESIINNFNFQYLYDFFYDTEKVKGKAYQPLHSPYTKEAVVITERSTAFKKAATDNTTHFFEDFSSNMISQKPTGWYSETNSQGSYSKVVTITGEEGKWLELKGHSGLVPNELKKPLPQNFTLSYDVIVPKDFTWGGKGLEMFIAKEKTAGNMEHFIRIRIKPGYSGRVGAGELETKLPPAYASGTKYYELPGFSNDKIINRITIMIKKKDETLELYADKKLIATYYKAMPADIQFNTVSFSHGRSDNETEKYFISNIKITKD
jgi:hypothetical protein